MKKISEIARARAIINMKSDDESSDSDSDDEEEFYRNMRREHGFIAIESTRLPWSESKEESSDDEPSAFCLMAKSSKDQVQSKHRKNSSDSPESIAYAKLVKIAKSQQDELDRLERTLRKSEGLLVEEMEKNQELTEEHEALSSTRDELSN
jgi:hypothetical protein